MALAATLAIATLAAPRKTAQAALRERPMRRIYFSVLVGGLAIATLAGCNLQGGNPFAQFGPPTIPPPGTSQGTLGEPYYSSPFVTLPPASGTNPSVTPRVGLGPSGTSSDGLGWQTPRTNGAGAADTNLVTARGASISRSATQTPLEKQRDLTPEVPIRIVENLAAIARATPSASASPPAVTFATPRRPTATGFVETAQLPSPAATLAPQLLPPSAPPSRTSGTFIPAVPRQNVVPLNTPPSNVLPPPNPRPRFSSSAPAERYDSAVEPAVFRARTPRAE